MSEDKQLPIEVSDDIGTVDGLWRRPRGATALYVLAHGAGAGMTHRFMQGVADRLDARRVATLRYQFPYVQAGRKRPDRPPKIVATIAAAFARAGKLGRGLPRFCGGKSFGGRLSSHFVAEQKPESRGLIYLGFPLHAPGREGVSRAAHLEDAPGPMLFIQGTRDKLADLDLMHQITEGLGKRATMHVIDDADHGFAVPKRTGRTHDDVLDEIADTVAAFCERHG